MSSSCKDCKVCKRLGIVTFLLLPFTVLYDVLFSWNIGLFIKKCPQCGHAMSNHAQQTDDHFSPFSSKAGGSCRDCKICTRLGIVTILLLPFTCIYSVLFSWNIGLFVKKCPQCGHPVKNHAKQEDFE